MRPARILESLLPFVDGKFVNLLVPYPMGFYAKGMDGRIDDPAAGWKGRGLWSTYGTRAPFMEMPLWEKTSFEARPCISSKVIVARRAGIR